MSEQSKGLEVDPDDLLQLLGKAITCAVLGKAGPQRSRQMGVLLRDERVESLARVPGFSTHSQVEVLSGCLFCSRVTTAYFGVFGVMAACRRVAFWCWSS